MASISVTYISLRDAFIYCSGVSGVKTASASITADSTIKTPEVGMVYFNTFGYSIKGNSGKTLSNVGTSEYPIHIHLSDDTIGACKIYITFSGVGSKFIYLNDPDNHYPISTKTSGGSGYIEPETKNLHTRINSEWRRFDKMVNGTSSYQLLRVNPKLTGNVKVVVDSSSNLYLDTFKVSTGLSQQKYRRICVNPEEYYGRTLMSKFKNMPSDDFYKVEDSCYHLFTPATTYDEQYYDKYNYGVRTNYDEMYTENYSLLAPLCIKKILPDFFLIFKVKDYESKNSDSDKIKYFFENGTLVKAYDMRAGSNLGTYIRNIQKNAKDYIGDVYTGYDYDTYNIFNGISIDRGIVTDVYESVLDERNATNQAALNNWYTLGFERNHIVSKNIVNFEFMFNDTSEELFSLNTYFGVYIRLNGESMPFSCINDEKYDDTHRVITFDNDDVINHTFNPANNNGVIYGVTTADNFIRLPEGLYDYATKKYTPNDTYAVLKDYVRKPYKNIFSADAEMLDEYGDSTLHHFMTITLNKPLDVGEHYRIIFPNDSTTYEVIISNYKNEGQNISDILYNEFGDSSSGTDIIQRVSIFNVAYRDDITPEDAPDCIKSETELLASALRTFDYGGRDVTIVTNKKDSITISVKNTGKPIFEKICTLSKSGDDTEELYHDEDDSMLFFGNIMPFPIRVKKSWSEFGRGTTTPVDKLGYYLKIKDFEFLGNRIVYAVYFTTYDKKMCYIHSAISSDMDTDKTFIYGTNGKYFHKLSVPIGYIKDNNGTLAQGTYNTFCYNNYGRRDGWVMITDNDFILGEKFGLYENYPINAGTCSILPIKDFDYMIYDKDNKFSSYDEQMYISQTGGEYNTNNNAFNIQITSASEDDVRCYIDKTASPNDDKITLLTYKDYVDRLFNSNHKNSDISLTSPYCCKWGCNGTDARGGSLRVMYTIKDNRSESNEQISNQATSYFIPTDVSSNYTYDVKMSRYLGFCGLGGYDTASGIKYVSSLYGDRLKDGTSMLNYILHGNGSIDDILYASTTSVKFSDVYSYGDDSIEFVSGGVKIRISSSNRTVFNLSKYNGYSGILISMPGNNPIYPASTSIIIDEVREQLTLIWYTGMISTECEKYNNVATATTYTKGNSNVFQIPASSKMTKSSINNTITGRLLVTPDDSGLYDTYVTDEKYPVPAFGGSLAYFFTESYSQSQNDYSKDYNTMLISHSPEGYNYFDDKYPNSIVTKDAALFVDSLSKTGGINPKTASNLDIRKYCTKRYNNVNIYGYLTGGLDNNSVNTMRALAENKSINNINTDLSNCSIFIKTHNGLKDYTNFSNIVSISKIEPIEMTRVNKSFDYMTNGKVHPTFNEPVMKDVVTFRYNESSDSNLSTDAYALLDGCNSRVDEISTISQLWINKIIPFDDARLSLSIDVLHKISVITDCWNSNIFRRYSDYKTYKMIYGIDTGYEKNMFFASRGLSKKGLYNGSITSKVEISKWKDSIVDESNGTIKLDISEALINLIMLTPGFMSNWSSHTDVSSDTKIRYIENSILNNVKINNKTEFTVFANNSSTTLGITSYDSSMTKVENVKNELIYENGKYYMMLKNLDSHMYSAKMIVSL